jgi:hypothetical protein
MFLTLLLCSLCRHCRPDYRETALYGRKWMNRFVLQLASMKDVVQAPPGADVKTDLFAAAQTIVLHETERLLSGFLVTERAASQYRATEEDEAFHSRFLALVKELLTEYNNMESEHLKEMPWLNPVLLSSCIQSKNSEIRGVVQKLVQRTSPASPVRAPPVVVAIEASKPPSDMPADAASEATDQNEVNDADEASPLETSAEATSSVDTPVSVPEGEAGAAMSNGNSAAESPATEPEESSSDAESPATELEEEFQVEEPASESESELEEEYPAEEPESESEGEQYEI